MYYEIYLYYIVLMFKVSNTCSEIVYWLRRRWLWGGWMFTVNQMNYNVDSVDNADQWIPNKDTIISYVSFEVGIIWQYCYCVL